MARSGMAFGVISTNARCWPLGMPPAQASALVHTAEIFTTGASAASHIYHRNVDWRLTCAAWRRRRAGRGARRLDSVECRRRRSCAPLRLRLSAADGRLHPVQGGAVASERDPRTSWPDAPVGFVAGFLDASGGGGWGPVADLVAGRRRTCAAAGDRFGQHRGVLCHGRGGDHLLGRARRVVVAAARAAGARRSVRRAVRRMGGEADARAAADDRGRRR